MKVIDLLNKIANGEEAPKRIKTKNDIWVYDDEDCEGIDYRASDDRGYMFEVHTRINKEDLNEEVEIIEEDEKIEKVNTYVLCDFDFKNKDDDNNLIATNILDKALEEYSHKINEIIDKLNEMEKE